MITALSLIISAAALRVMPDSIPMHFDMQGNIDRWGSKYEIFLLSGMVAVVAVIGAGSLAFVQKKAAAAKTDKERTEAKSNGKILFIVGLIMTLFSLGTQIFLIIGSLKAQETKALPPDFMSWVSIALGAVLVVIGNILPKTKPNGLIGARTKWSMYNDVTWAKSNRMCGILLAISGVISIAAGLAFSGDISMIVILASVIAATAASTAYSYFVYKDEVGKKE